MSSVKPAAENIVSKWARFIQQYVSLTDGQAIVAALWAIHTHVYDRFHVTPYLEIWAEGKRSGKSTLAEILCELVRGGRVLATTRVLSMVQLIESNKGEYVPFIEEAERFRKASLGDTRSILAAGYRRGAVHELKTGKYATFCPKAFVLIGNVHEIIRDRCISLKLLRHAPARSWTLERTGAEVTARDLVTELQEAFRLADVTRTEDGRPIFVNVDPTWLMSARDREIWGPLFSIARALRLPEATLRTLTRASMDLSILKTLPAVVYHESQTENVGDDQNAADAVLADARRMFKDGETRLPTDELLRRLCDIDTAVWRGWQGDGLSDTALAALMGKFGVSPKVAQYGSRKTGRTAKRGYDLADLVKASGGK